MSFHFKLNAVKYILIQSQNAIASQTTYIVNLCRPPFRYNPCKQAIQILITHVFTSIVTFVK